MFVSRIGHVLSVETHCASVIPQPHEQRAAFAARSALVFFPGDSAEKSTTVMSLSVYAMPDICETPYTIDAAAAPSRPHLISAAEMGREGLRPRLRLRSFPTKGFFIVLAARELGCSFPRNIVHDRGRVCVGGADVDDVR
jgi:hypothetical protein